MKLPSGKQMAEIDKETISKYCFPSILLMENAGRGIADNLSADYPEITNYPPIILAGPGNNGGDAFVLARQLFNKGIKSILIFAGDSEKLKGDAKINYDLHISLKLPEKGCPLIIVNTIEKWNEIKNLFFGVQFLIDGLFGIGFDGKPDGLYKEIIQSINEEFQGTVLAIDVPSGLICSDVLQNEHIIRADKTYTVGLPKLGMQDYPGKSFTGELKIIEIGFPEELLNSENIKTEIFTIQDAVRLKPERKPNSHKGDYGHVLVVGGCSRYPGAAHLSSLAALHAGAGLVTLASIFSVCQSLNSKSSEIITFPLPDNSNTDSLENLQPKFGADTNEITEQDDKYALINSFSFITGENFSEIKPYLEDYSVCVLGPGIGRAAATMQFVEAFIKSYNGNLVIDADALFALSNNIKVLKKLKNKPVLTPHPGEFSRLIGMEIGEIKKSRLQYAMSFAKEHQVILVLKDAVTLITDGEKAFYNTTGNAGLARGGSGDVLAGIIAAMISRNMEPLEAALFSVFLHGYTADILSVQFGEEGVFPTLLVKNLYQGFSSL